MPISVIILIFCKRPLLTDMGDILSSISILVAILTALYAMFYPEIQSFQNLEADEEPANNAADYDKGKSIRNAKVLPLVIGSFLLTLVFIPEFIAQLNNTWDVFVFNNHRLIFSDYSTVSAAYIVVSIFSIVLTISVFVLAFRFFAHLSKFKPN